MRIITVPPHSSDSERDDTGDFATRAREGGLRTFFERRRVDGTRYDLAVDTSRFRRASSDDAFSDVFDDPLDCKEAPRRTLISQGFAALRRTRAFVEAFDAFDAVDDPDDRSVLEELFDEEEYDDFVAVAAFDPEDSLVDDDRAVDNDRAVDDDRIEIDDRAVRDDRAVDDERQRYAVHRVIRVASIADSLTLLRRAPLRATQAHRFWSLPSRARQEEHEASWREEEAALFDAVATSIAGAPNVAPPPPLDAPAAEPLPHERTAPPAPRRALRGRANPRAAAAAPQGNRPASRPRSQRRRRGSHHRRSHSRRRTGVASRVRPQEVDCSVGDIFAPLLNNPLPLPTNIVRRVDRPSSMELKFELDTRLTVSCITVLACVYGFTTISVAINSVLLAFSYAVILLLIIFILFGLKDILTRKPSPQFR